MAVLRCRLLVGAAMEVMLSDPGPANCRRGAIPGKVRSGFPPGIA
jgi:hypothetical protein